MSEPFVICGLPRTRTAWLAAVCNTVPEAICYHEPLAQSATWQGVLGLLRGSTYRYAGASDHALGFHLPKLVEAISPRILIVARSRDDVAASLASLGFGPDLTRFLDILAARLDAHWLDPAVHVVAFDDLCQVKVVYRALRFLMPDATLCTEKIAEMQRLNVQADIERVRREAAAAQPRLGALLGEDVLAELVR